MKKLIFSPDELNVGNFASLSWVELEDGRKKYKYFVGRLKEKTTVELVFEVIVSPDKNEVTQEVAWLKEGKLDEFLPMISIPRTVFNHLHLSRKRKSQLLKRSTPLVYLKMEKMTKADINLLFL